MSQRNIDELKVIYKKTVGEELSDKEAWEMATRLLNLFRILDASAIYPRNDARDV